jgi:hypothetical protein
LEGGGRRVLITIRRRILHSPWCGQTLFTVTSGSISGVVKSMYLPRSWKDIFTALLRPPGEEDPFLGLFFGVDFFFVGDEDEDPLERRLAMIAPPFMDLS